MRKRRNGAEAVCEALTAAGVDAVFGVPGTQTVAFYEALRRSPLQTVTATNETAAAFMAQGFYRSSGRLAAVSAIPGPGFAFTLAALAEAKLDSAGLVLLTGGPRISSDGRPRSQAIDQSAVARPLVKEFIEAESASEAGRAVSQACEVAVTGEPGPVVVQFGPEAFSGECADASPTAPTREPRTYSGTAGLSQAVKFVVDAKRVLVYAGQGAAGAAEGLRGLVVALNALAATTPSGRGILPEDDPRVLPFDVTGDAGALNSIAAECDAILVIGAGLGENGSGGFGLRFESGTLVRVDASDKVLARPPQARFAVEAPAEAFVTAVLEEAIGAVRPADVGFDVESVRERRDRFRPRALDAPSEPAVAGGDAPSFFGALRRALPAQGCLVLDTGLHQLLARRHFSVLCERGLLFPSDFQSMGFGLPAAIGAKLADPSRAVVALVGDGGLSMTGLELLTAVRLRLPLPVVVFDDGALGLIRLDQILTHGRAHGTVLGGLDFQALAAAVGCEHVRVGIGDVDASIRRALEMQAPTLVVVPVEDAPSLRRAQSALLRKQAVKALAGPYLLGLCRSLRDRCRRVLR